MENENTLKTLQRPTMALIGAFYPMPQELENSFVDMIAIYEQNPTEENAKAISDKIMSRDSAADKKAWLNEQAAGIFPIKRAQLRNKHIDEKQPVPKGVPASGMFLTGMNVVSRNEKNALMDAQAAARILAYTTNCFDESYNQNPYYQEQGAFAEFLTEKANADTTALNKPFFTEIQRTEHLVKVLSSEAQVYSLNASMVDFELNRPNFGYWNKVYKENFFGNPFVAKAHNTALKTLESVAKTLQQTNPKVAADIEALAKEVQDADVFKGQTDTLTMQDFQDLKGNYKNESIAQTVEQIIAAREARVRAAEQTRNAGR